MSKKVKPEILKSLAEKNLKKYGTKRLGYRMCSYKISDSCIGEDKEETFKGKCCKACLATKLHGWYVLRTESSPTSTKKKTKKVTSKKKPVKGKTGTKKGTVKKKTKKVISKKKASVK